MIFPAQTPGGARLAAIVQNLSAGTDGSLAAKFTCHLFNEADTAELDAYRTSDLAAIASSAFETFCSRSPHEPKVDFNNRRIRNNDFLVLDIVNDDMPFLLD